MSAEDMLSDFHIEAFNMLEEAEEGLLKLDKKEEVEDSFNQVYRCFHSIKGAAGMFALDTLQNHVHHLESLLDQIQDKNSIPSNLVDYFLEGVDICRSILNNDPWEFQQKDHSFFYQPAPKNGKEPTINKVELNLVEQKIDKTAIEEKIKERAKMKIAIVDDEEDICTILSEILELQGYHTQTYNDPRDFLNQAESFDPDLLLSDIKMPQMSGLELQKKIHKVLPMLPVILISGFFDKETCIEAMANGASGMISKPFTNDQITAIAGHVIKKYRAFKIMNQSINCIMYQFTDLDDYLREKGSENMRIGLKKEVEKLLEQRKILLED